MVRVIGVSLLIAVAFLIVASDPTVRADDAKSKVVAVPRNFEVTMKSNKFQSDNIEIVVGDTVRWVNEDDHKHSVTTVAGGLTMPELMVEGEEHSDRITFNTAGEFKYKCIFHSGMAGTITVKK